MRVLTTSDIDLSELRSATKQSLSMSPTIEALLDRTAKFDDSAHPFEILASA
jgi:hypothetical protein